VYGGDVLVEIVTQPQTRPLSYDVSDVIVTEENEDKETTLHLVEGKQIGYTRSDYDTEGEVLF